jgi:hypothetical protein
MKKVALMLGIALSLFLVSCADMPFEPNPSEIAAANLTVNLGAADKTSIDWEELKIVEVNLTLTDPTGAVQTAQWVPGMPLYVVFQSTRTGDHTLDVNDIDTNGNVNTASAVIPIRAGYNYAVSVKVGGAIYIYLDGTNVGNTTNTNTNSTNTNVTPPAGGATFGIFSETVSNIVVFDTDAKIDIWNGMTLADDITTAGDGTTSWKLTGTDTNGGWMGMGVRVEPETSYRNLSAFATGSYRFMFKGTKGIKVGLKSGLTTESWFTPVQLMSYGLVTNGTWCTVSIPVSAFAGLNMSQIAQYLMIVADASTGYRNGDVFNIDNIYFTTNETVVGPVVTTFGLFTETYPVNVVWDTDGKMDVWNGFSLANDTTSYADGSVSLQLGVASSTWGGYAMRVEPLTALKDLSAFTGGSLKFSYKSTKLFTKVGIKSGLPAVERWVTGAVCKSTYGLKDDGTWSTVTIPLTAFAGIDLSKIEQYFMFVADGANWIAGNTWNIDNVYFVK